MESEDPEKTRKQKVKDYKEKFANPYKAASLGYIDEIINPRDTRKKIKSVGKLSINEASMQCFWGQEELVLTPTEFSILQALIDKDEAVSIEELVRATRQGLVEDNTINTHILHIRKKFKQVDAGFQCIKTRYGFGYQWACR